MFQRRFREAAEATKKLQNEHRNLLVKHEALIDKVQQQNVISESSYKQIEDNVGQIFTLIMNLREEVKGLLQGRQPTLPIVGTQATYAYNGHRSSNSSEPV